MQSPSVRRTSPRNQKWKCTQNRQGWQRHRIGHGAWVRMWQMVASAHTSQWAQGYTGTWSVTNFAYTLGQTVVSTPGARVRMGFCMRSWVVVRMGSCALVHVGACLHWCLYAWEFLCLCEGCKWQDAGTWGCIWKRNSAQCMGNLNP